MIPDYLHFLLSGVKAQEYTNATTTQLVNPKPETGTEKESKSWVIRSKCFYRFRSLVPRSDI